VKKVLKTLNYGGERSSVEGRSGISIGRMGGLVPLTKYQYFCGELTN